MNADLSLARKKYGAGMYGGKFMPYHLGHLYCLRTASKMCGRVYQILMTGCVEEEMILKALPDKERKALAPAERYAVMKAAGDALGNVVTIPMDISSCRTPEGTEDWDAETPLVLAACGRFDAVFSSEPGYDAYFGRAYPWAEHILVDPPRKHYPISGTSIREAWEALAQWRV